METINKILIANRSEIAARVQATCTALDIETVVVYTPEDAHASYVYHATEAYELPGSGSRGYSDQDALMNVAQMTGVDAVHPGYGFLAEHEGFASLVKKSGLIWIGPDPSCIEIMGNKERARTAMKKAGIPVIPGMSFDAALKDTPQLAESFANQLGYPIVLKCANGGGGKAMRAVRHPEQFKKAWEHVVSESKRFFSSSVILVETFIERGRHIEVQVMGDGNEVIHLFERECSVQRRHQKIIEEAPCPSVSQATLDKLYVAAIQAARTVHYNNVGTVEFLVTPDEQFYFLEMNTRLQVEHAVTEAITGIDLVASQIEIARTSQLPFTQHEITKQGHAIQCRIYAEDPSSDFTPSVGTLSLVHIPHGPFVRLEHVLEEGVAITPLFDPMIAKIITRGINRKHALSYMRATLDNTAIAGIETNLELLIAILNSDDFGRADVHTCWLELKKLISLPEEKSRSPHDSLAPELLASVACELVSNAQQNSKVGSLKISNWRRQIWE